MVFTDFEARNYSLLNGATRTYSIPYKCLVCVGDFRPDDSGGGEVTLTHNRRVQDSGTVTQFLMRTPSDLSVVQDSMYMMSAVAESGDTLNVIANDDFDVTVYLFRLPEFYTTTIT